MRFPFAMLLCARLVRSQEAQPEAGLSVRVERVISLFRHGTFVFQLTVDSTNGEHACTDTVVADVPVTLVRYKLRSIDVGVIAAGHGSELKSNSSRT